MPYQYLVFCFAHDPAPFVSCREQVVGRVFDTVNARRTVTTDEHNGRCLAKGAVRLWSALKNPLRSEVHTPRYNHALSVRRRPVFKGNFWGKFWPGDSINKHRPCLR